MTQRHPAQVNAFDLFDAAPPLRERAPPAGTAWCRPCNGSGHVGASICPDCHGSRLSVPESATLEKASS